MARRSETLRCLMTQASTMSPLFRARSLLIQKYMFTKELSKYLLIPYHSTFSDHLFAVFSHGCTVRCFMCFIRKYELGRVTYAVPNALLLFPTFFCVFTNFYCKFHNFPHNLDLSCFPLPLLPDLQFHQLLVQTSPTCLVRKFSPQLLGTKFFIAPIDA